MHLDIIDNVYGVGYAYLAEFALVLLPVVTGSHVKTHSLCKTHGHINTRVDFGELSISSHLNCLEAIQVKGTFLYFQSRLEAFADYKPQGR